MCWRGALPFCTREWGAPLGKFQCIFCTHVIILLRTTVHLLTRVIVEKLCKMSYFQSFTKWYSILLHFREYSTYYITLSFDFLYFQMRQSSFYIHEVSQQSHHSCFVSTSIHCSSLTLWKGFYCQNFFQPFVENTFGAVKIITSHISHSPHKCGYSHGYCGQFNASFIVAFRTRKH